jgi:transposase-like protein
MDRETKARGELEKFRDEEAAYEFVERQVWPEGPVCPHCGQKEHIGRLNGNSTRIHTYKCYDCRKPFTVKIGTIFEGSHVPMHKWLQAILLVRRARHVNASQAANALGVTFKTAVAMLLRIRDAARKGQLVLLACALPALLQGEARLTPPLNPAGCSFHTQTCGAPAWATAPREQGLDERDTGF